VKALRNDSTKRSRSTLSELRLVEGPQETRHTPAQVTALAIEATLTKARIDAAEIEQPVLAYFIDMAIAELRKSTISTREEIRRPHDRGMASVVRLVD
jgi:hypothetical protein